MKRLVESMHGLAETIIRFRVLVIVLVLAVTAFMGWSMKDLGVETDMLASLPPDDPLVILFNDVGERFGGNYIAMVALEAEKDATGRRNVFTHDNLALIRKLTKEFEGLEGVRDVISLSNIMDIKKVEGGIEVGKLLPEDHIPKDPKELTSLREYTLSKSMYTGSVVSEDGGYSVIVCRIQEKADKTEVAIQIKEIGEKLRGNVKLYYGGFPMIMDYMNKIIFHDMSILVPIAAIVVLITLFLSFRNISGVVLPLITVFLAVIWAMGAMSIGHAPITMVTTILPVVLLACGTAYGIHMVNHFQEDCCKAGNSRNTLVRSITEVGVPIIMAGLTTFIGFISLMSADLIMMQDFGLYSAIGIVSALILSITFVPAVLSFLPERSDAETDRKESRSRLLVPLLEHIASWPIKRRGIVLSITIFLAGVSLILSSNLTSQVNFNEYFAENSMPRMSQTLMEDKFGGSTPILVQVKGDMKDPAVVKLMRWLEQEMDAMPHVGNAQSIASLVAETNHTMNDRYVVPETRDSLGNLWVFLEGQDSLDQMVTTSMTEALVQAKIDKEDTEVINDVVETLERILSRYGSELVSIEPADCRPDRRQRYLDITIDHMAHHIFLDLASRTHEEVPSEEEIREGLKSAIERQGVRSNEETARIAELVAGYLDGDEAEIEIEPSRRASVVSAVEKMATQGNLNEKELETILYQAVSRDDYDTSEDYEEDRRYVPDMASSLVTLVRERISRLKVASILAAITPMLPPGLERDSDLVRDLEADIWELNESVLFVTPDQYRELTGTEAPADLRSTFSLRQTGLPIVTNSLDRKLYKSMAESTGLALLLVFFLLSARLFSFVGGLISILPIVFTVLINFGVMALLKVPLEKATMMVGSIAVGVGVDYTIHFTARFRHELVSSNDMELALRRTMATTGRAIVINTLTVALGFLVLLFSSTVPLQRFGWLTASTMLYSSLAAMILVPSVALATGAKYMRRNGANGNHEEV